MWFHTCIYIRATLPLQDNMNIPITDTHIHLSPMGKGVEAAKEFERAGGTHMVVVSLPSWSNGVNAIKPEDFDVGYSNTIDMVERVNKETSVTAWAIVGVHPAEMAKLAEKMPLEQT